METIKHHRMDKNLVGGGYDEILQTSHCHIVGIGSQCECGKCDRLPC
ncbi:hypothetical protein [Helicobacter enhydrae]|nr:hypothetical protein [Helicobacter enhydrae]